MTKEEIHDRFTYHPPSERGVQRHAKLTVGFVDLATVIDAVCPDGREKSLVMTNLEQAKFWASAAVARNEETR